jgi:uncharacterized phage protein gp47/JayE
LAPVATPVNVTAALTLVTGASRPTVTGTINAALAEYFASLNPGGTAYLNRIRATITETSGVLDYVLTAPAANVATLVDATHVQIPTLGVVTLT